MAHENVSIDETLFGEIENKISYTSVLSHLKRNNFTEDFEFESVKEIYDIATQNYILNFEINEDNSIVVNNKDGLKDFLIVCQHKLYRGLLDDDRIFKGVGKELKRR
ncbi:hypothetical protein [Methanococcoides seepicolus]|uniref:Uncharacterized protein n=1 Tax=Methanococcoides seepicolus TaxID=2828780 RepID=A0A9E4ZG40_9EURY|nr:hypothetical protein [Methanococcoides seepicolus]MCM1987077.1 hypothetical protein [Methanococcoides seepicolus]